MTGAALRAPGIRRAGLSPRSARWAAALALGAVAALAVAHDAGVAGPAAVPDVLRAAAATLVVFGICGYGLARLLTPASLAGWRPLFVLPLGAVASGLALTLFGFAALPFHVGLVLTLAGGIAAGIAARRQPVPEAEAPRDDVALAGVAVLAALIVALALVPTFRSGVATVTGFGSDAHQVTGSATLVQHAYPTSLDPDLPVDTVTRAWRSKFSIYYALAAVSSVAGLEPWQTLMTVSAILLALAATGFFLLARWGLGAPAGIAAVAMAVAVLDRWVFHLALHPYYNQLWGLLTLPFSVVLGYAWVQDRSPRTLASLTLVAGVGAFAYPLMLPFPALTVAGFWLVDRRERKARGEAAPVALRRFWHGRRSLVWIAPLVLLLAVPIRGVAEKFADAVSVIANPSEGLIGWQGDLRFYPPLAEFFAMPAIPGGAAAAGAIIVLAGLCLARVPRRLGLSLGAVLALALTWAVYFRSARYGQYLYFKVLAFAAPQILTAAVAGVALLPRRVVTRAAAAAAAAALCTAAVFAARDEIAISFDQLPPEVIELRAWSRSLPAGASVRLDTSPPSQLWQAYFMSDRPLGSLHPMTEYPHVPYSAGADYALDETLHPPPPDAVGAPVRRNSALRLWRLRPGSGPDTTSRRAASR